MFLINFYEFFLIIYIYLYPFFCCFIPHFHFYCIIYIVLNLLQSICKEAPFSDDPEALAERNACDYNIRITLKMARSSKG